MRMVWERLENNAPDEELIACIREADVASEQALSEHDKKVTPELKQSLQQYSNQLTEVGVDYVRVLEVIDLHEQRLRKGRARNQ